MRKTVEQIKAGRALLRWDQKTLAEVSGVSLPSIGRIEAGSGALSCYPSTEAKLIAALETAGVVFLDEGEASPSGGIGVRLGADKA